MLSEVNQPSGELLLRTMPMPADTNSNGDIFGGWIMSQMDIAGGLLAKEIMRGRCATVAANAFKFIRPVNVGDVVCCFGTVKRVGSTSLTLHLAVWIKRQSDGDGVDEDPVDNDYVQVTEADFTYVAIDRDRKKREFPKLDPRVADLVNG